MTTPQCMWSSSVIECASELMLSMQLNSSAAWCQRQAEDVHEPVFGNEGVEGDGKSCQAVRGP